MQRSRSGLVPGHWCQCQAHVVLVPSSVSRLGALVASVLANNPNSVRQTLFKKNRVSSLTIS